MQRLGALNPPSPLPLSPRKAGGRGSRNEVVDLKWRGLESLLRPPIEAARFEAAAGFGGLDRLHQAVTQIGEGGLLADRDRLRRRGAANARHRRPLHFV